MQFSSAILVYQRMSTASVLIESQATREATPRGGAIGGGRRKCDGEQKVKAMFKETEQAAMFDIFP